MNVVEALLAFSVALAPDVPAQELVDVNTFEEPVSFAGVLDSLYELPPLVETFALIVMVLLREVYDVPW